MKIAFQTFYEFSLINRWLDQFLFQEALILMVMLGTS